MGESITLEAAQAAIKKANEEALRACGAEIEAVLKKYSCQLAAVPLIEQGLIMARVQIQIVPPTGDRQ